MKPSELEAVLPHLIAIDQPVFIWGAPGIGKSEIVRACSEALGIGLVDLRLSIFDPSELKGYPVVAGTGKNQRMTFVPPAQLPATGEGILLLDELPGAPPSVQNAAYQLVLDRALGEYKLPPGWRIVAAGNHASSGGVHYTQAPALANRFIHLELETDQADWDVWAAAHGIDDLIRAYIRYQPHRLHDISLHKVGKAFPSGRSWAFANKVLQMPASHSTRLQLLSGTLGEAVALEFQAFVRDAEQLPSIKEVFTSPDTAKLPASPSARYAAITMVERHSTEKNIDKALQYIGRLPAEFQVFFAASVARTKRELVTTKALIDWSISNKALLGVAA